MGETLRVILQHFSQLGDQGSQFIPALAKRDGRLANRIHHVACASHVVLENERFFSRFRIVFEDHVPLSGFHRQD